VELFSLFNSSKKIDDYYLNGEDNEQYATAMGMPSWQTMNFRCSWSGWNPVTLQLGIDNIMDINYRTFSSGIHAPGRNFILAGRVNF
jgi:hemoglobin/transferrin/lactoferrin receptor protein